MILCSDCCCYYFSFSLYLYLYLSINLSHTYTHIHSRFILLLLSLSLSLSFFLSFFISLSFTCYPSPFTYIVVIVSLSLYNSRVKRDIDRFVINIKLVKFNGNYVGCKIITIKTKEEIFSFQFDNGVEIIEGGHYINADCQQLIGFVIEDGK